MSAYDVIIIGSGLGGLECAAILAREGMNVCLLEKNRVFGGCLQSFRRNGHLLDTGIHYVGSLGEGGLLRQYFKYFGILDRVRLHRLDEGAFDVICYGGREYNFAQGYERFADTLTGYFPSEADGIARYTREVKEINELIGVEHLRRGVINRNGRDYFCEPASGMIERTVADPVLQSVLAGTVTLYGGARGFSTLYHHAMINGSNIEGAYRFADGSQHVADALVDAIRACGGTVMRGCEATRICVEGNRVTGVEVNGGERLEARHYISNLHPARTFQLTDRTPAIRKAYISRIDSLRNTYGIFSVYLIMKPGSTPYINSNYYLHDDKDVWYASSNPGDSAVRVVLLSMQASEQGAGFADVVTLLCPMYFSEVARWADTTVGRRGEEYEEFKRAKAQEIIDFACRYKPELRGAIEHVHTATPLTYRDYTATPEGTAYGIMKDWENPLATLIPARTKLENLLLTGQNLNVHGMVGVTLTATLTCAELLGAEYIARKIGNV